MASTRRDDVTSTDGTSSNSSMCGYVSSAATFNTLGTDVLASGDKAGDAAAKPKKREVFFGDGPPTDVHAKVEVELTTVASLLSPGRTSPAEDAKVAGRSLAPPCEGAARPCARDEGEPRLHRPVRTSSARLQLKLMLWKHALTKVRDRAQLAASLLVPLLVFFVMWLLRKKPYYLNVDAFLVNIAFLLQTLTQVSSLVEEKKRGLKVLMTMSGLSPAIYTLSWFISEAASAALISLLLAIFARCTDVLQVNGAVSFFMVLGLLFLYQCASAAMVFFLSSLFSRPVTAGPFTFVLYIGLLVVYMALAFRQDKKNRAPGCADLYPSEVTWDDLTGSSSSYSYGGDDVTSFSNSNVTVPSDCAELITFALSVVGDDHGLCDRPGVCMATCGVCKPKDFKDVSGWTDKMQQRFTLVPTFALSLACDGFVQHRPPIWFRWPICGLSLSILLYTFLGWYIGEVMPGEFGAARPLWFILDPRYWKDAMSGFVAALQGCCQGCTANCCCCGNKEVPNADASRAAPTPSSAAGPGHKDGVSVQLEALRREFGNHVAVDNLTLDLMEGEIFALLGHNGAGKTTTVSMLTGMLGRTAGDAVVYGRRLSGGMAPIRQLLGVCPQHDVLFDYLTVGEHVDLFARLKGATLPEAARERAAMLEAFELEPRVDYFPAGLSGGMKRKVCVALALTGDTRLVILDEPTTGLDPGARRRLWDTLALLKRGRTILLTTHFMDEAEVLGDRIGIMKDGKLACVGSPVELKHQYEVGYELLVRQRPPPLAPASPLANPLLAAGRPPPSPRTIAGPSGADGVIGAMQRASELNAFVLARVPGAVRYSAHPVPFEQRFTLPLAARPGFGAFLRDLEASSAEMHIDNYGISMAPFEEVFLKVGSETSLGHKPQGNDNGSVTPAENARWTVGEATQYHPTFYLQARAVFIRRLQLARHSLGFDLHRLGLLPVSAGRRQEERRGTSASRAEGAWSNLAGVVRGVRQLPGLFRGVNTLVLVCIPLAASIAAIWLRTDTKKLYFFQPRTGKHPSDVEAIVPNILVSILIAIGYLFVPGLLAEVLVAEREAKVRNLLAVMGVDALAFWAGHAAADLMLLAIPVFGTWVALEVAGFDDFTDRGFGGANDGPGLFFPFHVLFVLELVSFAYVLSHAFTSPAFAMTIIPALCFGLLVLPIMAMLLTVQFNTLIYEDEPDKQLTLRELLSILLLSWAGSSPHGFFVASTIMTMFPHKYGHDHTSKYVKVLSEALSPVWAMVLLSIGKTFLFASLAVWLDVKNLRPLPAPPEPYHTPPEHLAAMDSDVRDEYYEVNPESPPGESVENGSALGRRHAIEYSHLRKVYPAMNAKVTVAVRDTNLHVMKGECFGLLGPNGAGKSTTVAMMTRHTPPTRGDASVMGHSVRTEFAAAARCLGVVFQDNSLYGELDSVEHLWFFARIRGVADAEIPKLVDESLRVMELQPHCRKPSKRLSGGMKRKLCTALSLIGNPPVVCMDEPSSGLDPSSRRNLWKVINETMRGRAVVLTTHLLDEAEALCGRIAIMCFGEVQCIGSAQHLRAKHGSDMGYQVILTTKELGSGPARDVAFAKVDAFVQTIFGGNVKLVNRHSRMLTYSVPSNDIHVPSAFSSLEGHLEPLQLDSYTICQPTLEQVFLKFTVEKDREHSALTNDAERLMAEAFDDTDIRIASAAVSRCCGLERPQHKRNACRFGILAPIFCLIWIFGSYSITDVLAPLFLNEKRQNYLPKSELMKRSRCLGAENSLPELDQTFEYSFTKYGSLQDNQTDFCRGLAVPMALNPNWHITNFSISVGISGDFDSKSGASVTSEWVDDDSVPPQDLSGDDDPGKGYSRSYHEDVWNEQVQIFLQDGFDLAPMSNWSYSKWWQQGGNDKFGVNLGSCGGCPHDKTEWGWYNEWTSAEDRVRFMANCSGRLNSWNTYTPVEGRCQAECDSPFFAMCIPQVSANRNVNDYWSSFRDSGGRNMGNIFQSNGANNFTVLALLDSGVNIRSCDTGLALEIKVGVNYDCDNSTGVNCAASGQFDVDNKITQGSTADYCAFYDGWDGEEYFGSGKLFAGVFFTLDGLFAISLLCCICACCGMCCTKTPEDDSNTGVQPKKKGRWF